MLVAMGIIDCEMLVGYLGWCFTLPQYRVDDFAVDVGQAVVAALKAGREHGVVEAELLQDGCLQVVDVDGVFRDGETQVVGGSVAEAALDAGSGEHDREAFGEVIAA